MRPVFPLAVTLACVTAALLAGCNVDLDFDSNAVQGDGRVTLEKRAVAKVSEIDMKGPVQVEVRVGPVASLEVEADSNLLPLIRTDSSGPALRVWVEGNVRSDHLMRVIYTTPRVEQIRASGSGDLLVSGLDGGALTLTKSGSGDSALSGKVGRLEIAQNGSGDVDAESLQSGNARLTLSGSGSMHLGQVSAETLSITIDGSGEVQASGAAASLHARVSGSGDIALEDLASERAELSTNGSGEIVARVSQALVAQTNGSGHITVHGAPPQRTISGKHVSVVN